MVLLSTTYRMDFRYTDVTSRVPTRAAVTWGSPHISVFYVFIIWPFTWFMPSECDLTQISFSTLPLQSGSFRTIIVERVLDNIYYIPVSVTLLRSDFLLFRTSFVTCAVLGLVFNYSFSIINLVYVFLVNIVNPPVSMENLRHVLRGTLQLRRSPHDFSRVQTYILIQRIAPVDYWQIVPQITDPSSRQREHPKTKSKAIIRRNKLKKKSGHGPQRSARHQDG
jgi:hypothetical protein